MIEPFFNELSVFPLCGGDKDVNDRINEYVQLLKFCGSIGVRQVRYEQPIQSIELKKNYTLHEYICEYGKNDKAKLILSMVRRPYIDEGSPEESQFVNMDVKLIRNNTECEAEGLTCAYLSKSFAIGFASDDYWVSNNCFVLNILNQISNKQKREKVFCISSFIQFGTMDFIDYVVCNLNPEFPCCNLRIEEKKIHLRDDHGKVSLGKFADKILKENYIVEVVNSLPYDPESKGLISKITDDGLLEIRLKDSDMGIGLVLKTTAQDRMLATYMAADLRQKYK